MLALSGATMRLSPSSTNWVVPQQTGLYYKCSFFGSDWYLLQPRPGPTATDWSLLQPTGPYYNSESGAAGSPAWALEARPWSGLVGLHVSVLVSACFGHGLGSYWL